jgi:hypothetical protein
MDMPSYYPEDDARTLQKAQEIQGDSKRHKAAQGHAKKQIDSLSKITEPSKPKAKAVAKPAAKPTAKPAGKGRAK